MTREEGELVHSKEHDTTHYLCTNLLSRKRFSA